MSTVNDRIRVDNDSSDSDGITPLTVPPDRCKMMVMRMINLGALHQLVVPTEDLGLDDVGEDLDFANRCSRSFDDQIPSGGLP